MAGRNRRPDVSFPLFLIVSGVVVLWLRATSADWTLWRVLLLLVQVSVVTTGIDLAVQHRRLAAAVVVTSAGAALLSQTAGLVDWSVWALLGRAWPIVIVALGIDLMLGRDSAPRLLAATAIGAGLVLAASLVFADWQPRQEPAAQVAVSYPLGEAETASVSIQPAVAVLDVGAATEPASLVEGTVSAIGSEALTEVHDLVGSRAQVTLSRSESGPGYWPLQRESLPRWELGLSSSVPLDLAVDLAVGRCNLELGELQLRSLDLEVGLGECTVDLPAVAGLRVRLSGGIGQLTLTLPPGMEARILLDTGLATTTLDGDFTRDEDEVLTSGYALASARAEIEIEQAIGSVVIRRR